jgi:hypothetical protein
MSGRALPDPSANPPRNAHKQRQLAPKGFCVSADLLWIWLAGFVGPRCLNSPHNPKVAGSNPAPATMNDEGLADVAAASPFRLPRLHPGIGSSVGTNSATHVLAATLG